MLSSAIDQLLSVFWKKQLAMASYSEPSVVDELSENDGISVSLLCDYHIPLHTNLF